MALLLREHALTHPHCFQKLGYGLGTANFKGQGKPVGDFCQKIVDDTVMAIKAGYYHLDGAEGRPLLLGGLVTQQVVKRESIG